MNRFHRQQKRKHSHLYWITCLLLVSVPTAYCQSNESFRLTPGPISGGEITLSWDTHSGVTYTLQHSADLNDWLPLSLPEIPSITTGSERLSIAAPLIGNRHFYRVEETARPFDPSWASVTPLRTITLGASVDFSTLQATIQALIPGDRLLLSAGNYPLTGRLAIDLQGTANAPIWIEAESGAEVIFQRTGASQNLVDMGEGAASFIAIRRIEFTGGAAGLRLRNCDDIWIDRCIIHATEGPAITANTNNTSHLHITRNEIFDTGDSAEGIYLGSPSGNGVTTGSIIALNHIHDLPLPTGGTGAGISVRQGCSNNWIAANLVHHTGGPSLFIAGTGGLPSNTIEGNTCHHSSDDGIFVLADCVVRNNLVSVGSSGFDAFRSASNSSGNPNQLTVVNNTFIADSANAARIGNWEIGTSMTFANNACYSQSGMAIRSNSTPTGVTFAGNIVFGAVSTGISGTQAGTGFSDFLNITSDAEQLDAHPSESSSLRAAASATFAPTVDLDYISRSTPHTTGCYR
ncbi:right-handed parallel beta-helix repeat-containing protein [Luteolibacter pohnpeiensis]|uniref:Right-handed parallel beta-helix repeat-containing protein n=1 Tax=Luteolibacter pohnpeiensis TaxID=454153 RepID=A0A934VUR9_9BACT|nr:right-handed parallel beta-helix repeat-containing protein [Luteolibacter pohnpeiensis]MBK1881048.1 right-handed parallel beta-helix repeat-containing protein [Luteolibacter pohnpeiensis]